MQTLLNLTHFSGHKSMSENRSCQSTSIMFKTLYFQGITVKILNQADERVGRKSKTELHELKS